MYRRLAAKSARITQLGLLLMCGWGAVAQAGPIAFVRTLCQGAYSRLDLRERLAKGGSFDQILEEEADLFRRGRLEKHAERESDAALTRRLRKKNPDLFKRIDDALWGRTSREVRDFIAARTDGLEMLTPEEIQRYAEVIGHPRYWPLIQATEGRVALQNSPFSEGFLGRYVPVRLKPFAKGNRVQVSSAHEIWDEVLVHELAHRFDFQILQTRMPAIRQRLDEIFERRMRDQNVFYLRASEVQRTLTPGSAPRSERESMLKQYLNSTEYWAYSVGAYTRPAHTRAEREVLIERAKGSIIGLGDFREGLLQDSREAARAFYRLQLEREAASDKPFNPNGGFLFPAVTPEAKANREREFLETYDTLFQDREVLRARDPEMFHLLRQVYGEIS